MGSPGSRATDWETQRQKTKEEEKVITEDWRGSCPPHPSGETESREGRGWRRSLTWGPLSPALPGPTHPVL